MKQIVCSVCFGLVALIIWCGCEKKQETPTTPPSVTKGTETPAKSIQQAVTDIQGEISKAMALAKDGKYAEALAALQQLLSNPNLTMDQKKSVEDAIAKIKEMMASAASSATEKALGGLPKSLPLK